MKAITGQGQLVLVVGPAGAGKTKATAYGVDVLRAHGRPVVGLAPSGKAADVLATEAGCPTDTLARLVDLVRHNEWRLVALGDPAQLAALGRGGVFAHWCETVPRIEPATPRRFDKAWEAEASLLLRTGDPTAVEAYAEHGRLRTGHPAVVPLDVARTHRRHVAAGRSVAITTNSAETARAINLAIQRAGTGGPTVRLAGDTTAGVGDQIATRRNDLKLRTDHGEKVRNRHTWTVSAAHTHGSLTAAHPDLGQQAAKVRAIQQRLDALQTPRSGQGLGL